MRRAVSYILVAFSVLMFISGCTSVSSRLQPVLAPAQNMGDSVICCKDKCKIEWQRAQVWVAKHSKWKIQTATDVLIQTYNPAGYDPSYGFTITKEPIPTRAKCSIIEMELYCGNPLGCDPRPSDVKKAFYYYITTGVDLLEGQIYLDAIQ